MTAAPFFDFEKGEFLIGRNGTITLVTGVEALINWIQKILRTVAGRYRIYFDSGYGNNLENLLIGKSLPRQYIAAEVERTVKDALLQNDEIISADSFSVEQNGAMLSVRFNVSTIYGEAEINEVI